MEHVVPSDPAYIETMRNLQHLFTERGSTMANAQSQAFGMIG